MGKAAPGPAPSAAELHSKPPNPPRPPAARFEIRSKAARKGEPKPTRAAGPPRKSSAPQNPPGGKSAWQPAHRCPGLSCAPKQGQSNGLNPPFRKQWNAARHPSRVGPDAPSLLPDPESYEIIRTSPRKPTTCEDPRPVPP